MIKKIVEISESGRRLSVRYGQLVVKEWGPPTEERSEQQLGASGEERSIPCEDIGVLLVDHQGVSYTHSVFTELLRYGAAVVLCGANHHPAGMLLPLESNTLQSERFRAQIEAKEPVKKRLWKQIVRAKILHQAMVLGKGSEGYQGLLELRRQVRSGDTANVEARASRLYWGEFISGMRFRRDREGSPPNNLLNYGYMVMRAAVARALVSAGLHPSIGIHHRNRYNAFCLADDVVEPFRGFVERKVREIWEGGDFDGEMDQQTKARLLEVLYEEVSIGGVKGPLMVRLHAVSASLVRCFEGEQREIDLPEL